MKRFFLIDFENVADAGLNGFFELTAEDTVDLFYTQKNNRISMDFFKTCLEQGTAAKLNLRRVASGNQALDLQLASFLGSLIAGSEARCEYCIISKDKGFGCLPAFWENQRGNGTVRQAGSIREAVAARPDAPAPQPSAAHVPAPAPAPEPPKAQPAESAAPPAKAEPETEKALSAANPAEKPAPAAAEEKPKPAAGEGEKPKAVPQLPNEKTVLNVKIQQTLSKAKCDTQVISQTASTVAKAFGDPKIKQIVYRDLIKRYGQKQGLEVYNLVKPLLK